MKPFYTVVVFVTLLSSSVWAGMHSYRCAEEEMVADMNQALIQTLRHKQEAWITPDTIRDYRSNLRLELLRRHSLVCYAEDGDPKTVASSKLTTVQWLRCCPSLTSVCHCRCSPCRCFGCQAH